MCIICPLSPRSRCACPTAKPQCSYFLRRWQGAIFHGGSSRDPKLWTCVPCVWRDSWYRVLSFLWRCPKCRRFGRIHRRRARRNWRGSIELWLCYFSQRWMSSAILSNFSCPTPKHSRRLSHWRIKIHWRARNPRNIPHRYVPPLRIEVFYLSLLRSSWTSRPKYWSVYHQSNSQRCWGGTCATPRLRWVRYGAGFRKWVKFFDFAVCFSICPKCRCAYRWIQKQVDFYWFRSSWVHSLLRCVRPIFPQVISWMW